MDLTHSRRRFLYQHLAGVGGLALLDVLNRDLLAAPKLEEQPLAPKQPHHPPKA
jgi:hypothetical protein